jgi:hypothetical protein
MASLNALTQLERAALELLLAGSHPVLVALRHQYQHAQLVKRETRGDGFHCYFAVDDSAPAVAKDFELGDVQADLPGLINGAGFLLFVRGGRLDTLQGFTYLEPWPARVSSFTLSYAELGRVAELAKLDR